MKSLISVSKNKQASLRTRLALGTALATIAFGYGGRGAFAGVCNVTVSPSFLCSGPVSADVTQNLSAVGVSVTTSDDFEHTIGTSGSSALNLTRTGGLTFNDTGLGGSAISAHSRGINANNTVSGGVNVITNGAIPLTGFGTGNGKAGVFATNSGAGDLTVTTNNIITTTTGAGIDVRGRDGNYGANFSTGSIIVNANGAISAGNYRGIVAFANTATPDITITAGAVSGSSRGIEASNNIAANNTIDVTTSGVVSGGT
jgi:hypothetical protein